MNDDGYGRQIVPDVIEATCDNRRQVVPDFIGRDNGGWQRHDRWQMPWEHNRESNRGILPGGCYPPPPPCDPPPRYEPCNRGRYMPGWSNRSLIPMQGGEMGQAYNNSYGQTWNQGNGYAGQITEQRFGNGMGTTGVSSYQTQTFPTVQPQPTFGGSVFGMGGYPSNTGNTLGRIINYSYDVSSPTGGLSQWSRSFSDGVRSFSQWANNGVQNVMSGWSNSPMMGGYGATTGGLGQATFGGGFSQPSFGGFGQGSFGGVSNLSAAPFGNALGFSGSSFMGGGMGFRFI